jgi:hypothetical protein
MIPNSTEVQPQIRLSSWQSRNLTGHVETGLYNVSDLEHTCSQRWPELHGVDPAAAASSCAVFKAVSACGNNLDRHFSMWNRNLSGISASPASPSLDRRPIISAALNDNITGFTSSFGDIDDVDRGYSQIRSIWCASLCPDHSHADCCS